MTEITPKLSGEIWYVICISPSYEPDDILGLSHFDFTHKHQAINWCKERPIGCGGYTPIAITNKTTWTEGDGMELLNE